MNFWGKLIGGVLGYMMGGLFGGLIGALLGHQFDRGLANFSGDFSTGLGGLSHGEIQRAFFEATFSVMGHLAKADGRVSEEEIALARHIMVRMGLSESARHEAIVLFSKGKESDFVLGDMLVRFHNATRRARNLQQMFIEIQLHAAYADGDLNPAEKKLLLVICDALGFSTADFDRLESMVRAEQHATKGGRVEQVSLDDAYAILNVTSESSDAEVKRAYRKLTNQHHPDKLVAKGLPEEMMKLAEEKTHEIRAAYERIREARGTK
ncbi:MAG: co-chaperone DjlA [Gammaproteobacteria bacterium]|nr:co-chaperone DjlA [Gammaproteobacteria bacterium]